MVATGVILFVFVFERLVRTFGYGSILVFRPLERPIEILDNCIITGSIVVYCMVLYSDLEKLSKSILTVSRIIRLLRLIKVNPLTITTTLAAPPPVPAPRLTPPRLPAQAARFFAKLYPLARARFAEDGFRLDLSFITGSCIAMSLPVFVRSAAFRNPLREVRRFLSARFPGRFLVFNLCADAAAYADDAFAGRVARIPVELNNPPRMHQMAAFARRAARFLDDGPGRCIAVHCTRGEGRTGAMVAAWLLYRRVRFDIINNIIMIIIIIIII